MALTTLQRDVCRLLADARRATGESYIAGGVALSVALRTSRLSRDLDVFHDAHEAVVRSWNRDGDLLRAAGFRVTPIRELPVYVEAEVARDRETLVLEWARDSAFRFFPLVEHPDLGLTLHPFDLATNKVLALVGRLEARDWVDVIACHERLQPLGYLAWAACGKDPGFTPQGILAQARRSSRYSDAELASLSFEGAPPSAADSSRRWHAALAQAEALIDALPAREVGKAVMTVEGTLFSGDAVALAEALSRGQLAFHPGRIGGALPHVRDPHT